MITSESFALELRNTFFHRNNMLVDNSVFEQPTECWFLGMRSNKEQSISVTTSTFSYRVVHSVFIIQASRNAWDTLIQQQSHWLKHMGEGRGVYLLSRPRKHNLLKSGNKITAAAWAFMSISKMMIKSNQESYDGILMKSIRWGRTGRPLL